MTLISLLVLSFLGLISCAMLPGEPGYSCINASDIVYNNFGQVSYVSSFVNCLKNLQDGLVFPGYSSGKLLNVSVQVVVNNLISIDEVQSSVTLDLFLLLSWVDPRLSMPILWETASPSQPNIEISQALEYSGVQGTQPTFWMPDLVFPNLETKSITNMYVKLFPGGQIWWQRHITLELVESSFNYKNYPDDRLDIEIAMQSFAMSASQVQLINFDHIPFQSYSGQPSLVMALNGEGQEIFSLNPIWALVSTNIKFDSTRYSQYNSYRSTCAVTLVVQRRSSGLVYRLILPIYLLLLIGATLFWSKLETGVGTTLTLLLAVSALYIVVFSQIPMVGYLTKLDRFGLGVYAVLFSCVMMHQILISLAANKEKNITYPLRNLCAVILESLCRIVIIPSATAVFATAFYNGFGEFNIDILVSLITVSMTVLLSRQGPHIMKQYQTTKKLVIQKLWSLPENTLKMKEQTLLQLIYTNWVDFIRYIYTLHHIINTTTQDPQNHTFTIQNKH